MVEPFRVSFSVPCQHFFLEGFIQLLEGAGKLDGVEGFHGNLTVTLGARGQEGLDPFRIGRGEIDPDHPSLALADQMKILQVQGVHKLAELLRAPLPVGVTDIKLEEVFFRRSPESPAVVEDGLVAGPDHRRDDLFPHLRATESVVKENDRLSLSLHLVVTFHPVKSHHRHLVSPSIWFFRLKVNG